jgi:predicted outer membrane protein
MKRFLVTTTCATLATVALCQEPPAHPPGHPQQPTTTQQPRNNTQPGAQSGTQTQSAANDATLVTWLLVDNENEIALSRIALQKAQSAEVKQFAQQMIDDHGKMVQKLQQLGGANRVSTAGGDTTRPDPNRPADPTKRATDAKGEYPAGQPMEASGVRSIAGGIDHERLIRDLGRKCQESSTKMLQEKQGAEFDKCYMGMQLGAHMKAVDMLEVFRNYASPSLRPAIEEALPTVQMHLQHAKDIAKKTEVASADATRK